MINGVPSGTNQSSAGGKRRILLRDNVRLGISLGTDKLASVAPAGSGSVQREIEAPREDVKQRTMLQRSVAPHVSPSTTLPE